MFSATDFLPSFMIEFMNLDTIRSPNLGSGLTSRFSALCRRDIRLFLHQSRLSSRACPSGARSPRVRGSNAKRPNLLGPFCTVFRTSLLAVGHALRVEHAADDVIAHARQVLDAAAADHHHRVLLQIVALARDVADHLEPICEPYLGHLAQG